MPSCIMNLVPPAVKNIYYLTAVGLDNSLSISITQWRIVVITDSTCQREPICETLLLLILTGFIVTSCYRAVRLNELITN